MQGKLIGCVDVSARNFSESKIFYEKIGLFKEIFDYGMNTVVFECNKIPGFSILLKESDSIPSGELLFTLYIDNVEDEYYRIKSLNFDRGGLSPESEKGIFKYPAGKNFMLIDPNGNRFLISSLLPDY